MPIELAWWVIPLIETWFLATIILIGIVYAFDLWDSLIATVIAAILSAVVLFVGLIVFGWLLLNALALIWR